MVFPILPMVILRGQRRSGTRFLKNFKIWNEKWAWMRRHLVQSGWKFVPQHQADELLPGRRVPGCLGAGALGKSWKMFHFWAIVFELLKTKWKKMMKSVKFARIGFLVIQNESPHCVLDSPGGFGKFFRKKGGNENSNFPKNPDFADFPGKSRNKRLAPKWGRAVCLGISPENPENLEFLENSNFHFPLFFGKIC